MIPTTEEIEFVSKDGSSLAFYVFTKLINEVVNQLEDLFNVLSKASSLEPTQETEFTKAYTELVDELKLYKARSQGGKISIDNSNSNETTGEGNLGIDVKGIFGKIVNAAASISRKKTRKSSISSKVSVTGEIKFRIDTQVIEKNIRQMSIALGIEHLYICLDEYSEIDKVTPYSIQSNLAQLIKQVFFKNSLFVVKIASIWNNSRLHDKGANRVGGIEYQEDIFDGPDLDTVFMLNEYDATTYFRNLLVNTYYLCDDSRKLAEDESFLKERESRLEDIEKNIFGIDGLRHLICGAQGVSRSFVVLAKNYLERMINDRCGIVKLGTVYAIIKQYYMDEVRSKIPCLTLYKVVNQYVLDNQRRYFLICETDYERCKNQIKYYASKGLFVQLPGAQTDRRIRNEYKLFIIHYGNYLDALESASSKTGRKQFEEDSKLGANGSLFPKYENSMFDSPNEYTLKIPDGVENEVYCPQCRTILDRMNMENLVCPRCKTQLLQFATFIDLTSI